MRGGYETIQRWHACRPCRENRSSVEGGGSRRWSPHARLPRRRSSHAGQAKARHQPCDWRRCRRFHCPISPSGVERFVRNWRTPALASEPMARPEKTGSRSIDMCIACRNGREWESGSGSGCSIARDHPSHRRHRLLSIAQWGRSENQTRNNQRYTHVKKTGSRRLSGKAK
jgi:hypothetical protein